MKAKWIVITMLLSICIFNCTIENQSQLEGTWQPISKKLIWPDTTITSSENELSRMVKIINKTQNEVI